MTQRKPPKPSGTGMDRAHRAEIVDRLYDVALDPIRIEDLLDIWERRIGPLRDILPDGGAASEFQDNEIEAHLRRATVFLDRLDVARADGGYRSILDDIARSAALVSDANAAILGFNGPAAMAFGLKEGARLGDLPFDAEDIAVLQQAIARVASGREEKVITLRVRAPQRESPVLIRVGPLASGDTRQLALVVSTDLVWPEVFSPIVQEAFGLTETEVEIVRAIALGHPMKEIAADRGRSAQTVRTQMRSILAKTETHGQAELLRVILGLMDLAVMPSDGATALPKLGARETQMFQHVTGTDGRRLGWIEFGAPSGMPCLVVHTDYGLIRWPAEAEKTAERMGMRVIVPVRAGYGESDEPAAGADPLLTGTQDYLTVLDHLRIGRVAVLVMGSALRFALNLALVRPDLVTGILGTSCQLPLQTMAQLERMDKWQRFTAINARHAPNILPFVVKAGFAVARLMGKEAYFARANGGSRADMATFVQPDVREALLAGSEVLLGANVVADRAYTRECIGAAQDWSNLIARVGVPVRLLQGDQDPMTPVQTVRELMLVFPSLDIAFVENAGQLLFFTKWRQVLQEITKFLPRR